jgi:hypothetical protein
MDTKEKNRLKIAKWRAENPDKVKAQRDAYQPKWQEANREKTREYAKAWRDANPAKVREQTASKKAAKKRALPSWAKGNKAIVFELECVYAYAKALNDCGLDYHVDHIVPLQGKVVRGLHLPWNLQVLPAVENIRKRNHFDPRSISLSTGSADVMEMTRRLP